MRSSPSLSDPWERSEVLLPLSVWASRRRGRSLRSATEEVLALKREADDVISISDSLNNLGWDALLSGDIDRAIPSLEEAVAIARELGDTFRLTLAIGNLGHAAVLQERYAEGLGLFRETLAPLPPPRRPAGGPGGRARPRGGHRRPGSGRARRSARRDPAGADGGGRARLPGDVARAASTGRSELARDRLGPDRVAALEGEIRDPTLELALELLDAQTTSIASPNE